MKTKADSVHNNLSRKIKNRIKPANISGCTINPRHGCLKHGFSLFLQPGPTPKFCGFHHTHLSQHLAAAPQPAPTQENHPREDHPLPCYLVSPEQCLGTLASAGGCPCDYSPLTPRLRAHSCLWRQVVMCIIPGA